MYLKNKNVLIIGLGITGISAVKTMEKLEANISIYDSKSEEDLKAFLDEIENIEAHRYLNGKKPNLEDLDLILKSPGVPLSIPILIQARNKDIEIITDLELYYRMKSGKNMIAITGTNGKTTTTKLTGEIFEKAGHHTYVAGNIGVGVLDSIFEIQDEDVMIIEASSFQLENTVDFKPHISAIINITPDHISWHGNLENYIRAKKKILFNQDKDDYAVLNYDDKLLREMGRDLRAKVMWFSLDESLENGAFIEDGWLVFRENKNTKKIIRCEEIQIPGKHNLENILASSSIAYLMGLSIESISKALREFKGVEHRIEYVATKDEVSFYNDSKGTNPESTIKAIEAIDSPIILIAGGYDKGSEYDKLIAGFKGKVKELVLLGETSQKIRDAALKLNFTNIHLVENMDQAVKISFKLADKADNILLSPACASWGMYRNFEERGKDFKNIVKDL